MHGFYTLRGLHGHRGDRGDSVTIMSGKCFQVRGNARAGGRIKSRDRQNDRRSCSHMV